MPYETTPAQQAFLRKKFAKARDEETGCDCPGGQACPNKEKPCKGFVRNCTCDLDMESLRASRQKRKFPND